MASAGAVFITGASSGIGAALAREFARRGFPVALTARREERLAALERELGESGHGVFWRRADVTVDGEVDAALAAARESLGPIGVVVANAGFAVVGSFESLALTDYRRQFETNVFGVLRTARAALPYLADSRGVLVIVGSVSGHVALAGNSAYAMSKFAVRALSHSLRHELAPRGVGVVLVSPGFVRSEIAQVDNLGRWHAEPKGSGPRRLAMSAERCARQIARAGERRQRERVVTVHGKLAVFFQRHAPWLMDRAIRSLGVKAREPSSPKSREAT